MPEPLSSALAAFEPVTFDSNSERLLITAAYMPAQRRAAKIALIAFTLLVIILPIGALLSSHRMVSFIPAVWIAGMPLLFSLISWNRVNRQYRFTATLTSLTVESSGPFGKKSQQFAAAEVEDIRLTFAANPSQQQSRSPSLVIVQRGKGRSRRIFLQQFERGVLVEVAAALRERLGLPIAAWK